jgi:acetyl esterase/lipase
VVIHGGFWKAEYDASLGRPLAESLAGAGWTAWNLEYRRVGNGGGWPQTLDDVATGIDALADVGVLDTSRVITLGHSAGGHLATWAAARGRFERWQPERVPVTGVVSQAGVLDLCAAHELGLGGGAVEAFLGHPPGPVDDQVDPLRQLPLDVPVRCVHGRADTTVPISQSRAYVDDAKAAGADVELLEVDGDHFVVIDPTSDAWSRTLELLASL